MHLLSDRTRSESDGYIESENELVEEFVGWQDAPESDLDVYLKNKKLDTRLIRLANERVLLSPILRKYQVVLTQQYSPSGWSHKGFCPFKDHNEKTPSFHYNPQENRFNCFGCQRGGKAVQFVSYMENKPTIQVAKELLSKVLREDEIIFEIDEQEDNFKIRELLFDYASYLALFIQNHSQGIQYAETITLTVDGYIRNHMPSGSIIIDDLEGRIQFAKDKLDCYGDEEQ